MVGSSPLARGLRRGRRRLRWRRRIIPARAGFTEVQVLSVGIWWDHPRSRGVYLIVDLMPSQMVGSSPLARGLQLTVLGHSGRPRIIPARAGFTRVMYPHSIIIGDHPRSRGVYHSGIKVHEDFRGSSPLARGLPESIGVGDEGGRIIPARAGFTGVG